MIRNWTQFVLHAGHPARLNSRKESASNIPCSPRCPKLPCWMQAEKFSFFQVVLYGIPIVVAGLEVVPALKSNFHMFLPME